MIKYLINATKINVSLLFKITVAFRGWGKYFIYYIRAKNCCNFGKIRKIDLI